MSDFLQGSSILLYGPPKIGKTQMMGTFPKPIVWIATERGHRYLSEEARKYIVPVFGAEQWEKLKSFVRTKSGLAKIKPKTVVVDTLNNLYSACFQAVCQKEGIKHPADKGKYGQSIWHMIRMEFYGLLGDLVGLCAESETTIAFVCHSTAVEMQTRSKSWQATTYSLPTQLKEHLPGVIEHIWYLGHANEDDEAPLNERVLHLKGDAYLDADTRDPAIYIRKVSLTDSDGKIRDAWKYLSRVFDKSHEKAQ